MSDVILSRGEEVKAALRYCVKNGTCDGCPGLHSPRDCELIKIRAIVLIEALEIKIAGLEAERRWIPVGERLPSADAVKAHHRRCLEYPAFCVMVQGANLSTSLYFDGKRWYDDLGHDYNVTHWMPLPKPPGGEVHA